jgi:hypothetical protein
VAPSWIGAELNGEGEWSWEGRWEEGERREMARHASGQDHRQRRGRDRGATLRNEATGLASSLSGGLVSRWVAAACGQ